jgi:hypothetical protein
MLANRHHGLRDGFAHLPQACPSSTTENGNFHDRAFLDLVRVASSLILPGLASYRFADGNAIGFALGIEARTADAKFLRRPGDIAAVAFEAFGDQVAFEQCYGVGEFWRNVPFRENGFQSGFGRRAGGRHGKVK